MARGREAVLSFEQFIFGNGLEGIVDGSRVFFMIENSRVQSSERKCFHRLGCNFLGDLQKKVNSEHNLCISCKLPVQVNV